MSVNQDEIKTLMIKGNWVILNQKFMQINKRPEK